jgi:uncharacterized membrane protein
MPSDAGSPQSSSQPGTGSLTHSAAKATTYNVVVIVADLFIFSAGAGGIVGGGVLTAFNVAKSLFLYTANDYAWDTYFPSNTSQEGSSEFDPTQSVWRTTEKFLTYKPVSTAIKFASIFVYTGSASAMFIYGAASEVVNVGAFYLNNFAWDVYDWSQAPPQPAGSP